MKITVEEHDLLRYLATLGLKPGASLEVVERAPLKGPITVKMGRKKFALSREVASIIWVKRPQ